MEHLLYVFFTNGTMEVGLIFLGFIAGRLTQWMLPIQITILFIKTISWYLKTHPHGMHIDSQTHLLDKLDKMYPNKTMINTVTNIDWTKEGSG